MKINLYFRCKCLRKGTSKNSDDQKEFLCISNKKTLIKIYSDLKERLSVNIPTLDGQNIQKITL